MAYYRTLFLILVLSIIIAVDICSAAYVQDVRYADVSRSDHRLLPDCSNQLYQPGDNYQKYYQRSDRSHCMKEWAVLVYMAADNDLTPYAFWDLYEMESRLAGEANLGASTSTVDVLVELDTFARTGVQRYHVFQSDEAYDATLRLEDFKEE